MVVLRPILPDPIQPFSDMYIAPIPLSFVVSVVRLVVDQNVKGLTYELSQNLAEIEALKNYLETLQSLDSDLKLNYEKYYSSHAVPLLEKLQMRYSSIVNQLKTT